MTPLLPGLALGGMIIATLGGISEYLREKRLPSPKGLMRDFLIGAVMVGFLYQILPESMSTLTSYLPGISLPAVAGFTGLNFMKEGGSVPVPTPGTFAGGFDPDLQIGMPKF
jgi:hypothetical protein